MCGNNQYGAATFITILPWVFILGILNIVLTLFPGWLSPFSNTFGYGMAKLVGLQDLMKRLLVSPQFNAAPEKKIINAVNSIYDDPSIFINQFSYANRDDFNRTWDNSYAGGKGIFVKSAGPAPLPYSPANPNPAPGTHLYQEFRNMVKLKDIVGTFIWYILVGVIVTSRSYNYIISQPCSLNASVAQKAVDNYIKNTAAAPKTIDELTPKGFSYKLN